MCSDCLADHLLTSTCHDHKPTPIRTPALDDLLARKQVMDSTCKDQDCSHTRTVLNTALETVMQFRASALMDLQRIRQDWMFEVDLVFDELVQTVTSRTRLLSEKIQQRLDCLEELKSVPEDLSDITDLKLRLQLRNIDLGGVLKKAVDLVVSQGSGEGGDKKVYKFFGGSDKVAVFDPRSETVEIKVTPGQNYFHNSSWCVSPSGHIYITGGSLTGRSRSDCLIYRIYSNVALESSHMQVARRSHTSIYYNRHCYVFGGLVDTERTSLCERFTQEQEAWETLPQMKERRAYLGCCELQGKIYIAGGAGSAMVEVFDPETCEFQQVSLRQLELGESCSLIATEDSVLLFHGTFNGEVSHWSPSTNQLSTYSLSFGNSWSSCSPLLLNHSVYLLRSDSIYRFDLDSFQAVFLLRLSKTPNRAGSVLLS